MSDFDLSIKGLDEFQSDLERAIKKYPDMAEERLRNTVKNFRKDVVDEEKEAIKDDKSRIKKKLTNTSSYEIGKTRGYNEKMEVDFSAKSKHFHLVENGHELVNHSGQTIGWVEGNHVVKKMREQYAAHVLPFEMDQLLKDIVRECDLD